MYKEITVRMIPEDAVSEDVIKKEAARSLGIEKRRVVAVDLIKRSVDARQRQVMLNMLLGVYVDEVTEKDSMFEPAYRDVSSAEKVIVVGAGPAGLFAALRLIERGFRPVILERGKSVKDRKSDLAALYQTGIVNEDSNFGFGEGGAGTFSDGKLYTRSKKRGNTQRILEILVRNGADKRILTDAHPHLGTDKLSQIIVNVRKTIEQWGGQVLFKERVSDLLINRTQVVGVVANGKEYLGKAVILATGHSARDVYRMLNKQGVAMEVKDFAVGMRLEHPQTLIDSIQYHNPNGRGDFLPAAEYSFVTNICGRGVYSFCMCPGGIVVPAATGAEQQVVNGMSSSGRNTNWANSAMVTSVGVQELTQMGYQGLFAGMEFQAKLEKEAWQQGGKNLYAPAQRLTDFLQNKTSSTLPLVSYKPGVTSSALHEWFPTLLRERLQMGLRQFGQKAHGFLTEEATMMGVETRTSSPLRIPRNAQCCHIEIERLYPCGEGSGYAGGIVSAAMDGERCADMI